MHAGLARADGLHAHRPAGAWQIPQRQIEEVHGLLEDPRTDARLVIAPASRALPVGVAEERDVHMLHGADGPLVDQLANAAPQRREAALQADGDLRLGSSCRRDDRIAVGKRRRHRLFEQHMLAGVERGDGDGRVQVIGCGDGNGFDLGIAEDVLPFAIDDGAWMVGLGSGGAVLAVGCDRREPGASAAGNRARMEAPPGPVSRHRECHALCHAVLPRNPPVIRRRGCRPCRRDARSRAPR